MKRMHVWVIEAQHVSKPGSRWTPVTHAAMGRCVHRTRFMARKVAKHMQQKNIYNKSILTVRYRARKYETAGE